MSQRRRRSEPEHEEGPSAERWLLTYADMITLLMVLFIVLFALGETNIRKFNAFKDSFHQLQAYQAPTSNGGQGILSQPSAIAVILSNPFAQLQVAAANSDGGKSPNGHQAGGQASSGSQQSGQVSKGQSLSGQKPTGAQSSGQSTGAHNGAPALTPAQERAALSRAAQELEQALRNKGLEQDVHISLSSQGLIVSILTDKVLFPLDSAAMQPAGVQVIDAIAPVLAQLPNDIAVEGDTDDTPITGGPYNSNWALSAARAVAVVQVLIAKHGLGPDRLQAIGYGDTRPVVPNNTPQHRAENRRVEIVIFSTTTNAP